MTDSNNTNINNTEYKSENPIIQKCLDILDNPNVKILETYNIAYTVYIVNERKFTIFKEGTLEVNGGIDNFKFTNKTENGLDFSDITLIWDKVTQILQSREPEKVQKA